jgi:hypothetical protein
MHVSLNQAAKKHKSSFLVATKRHKNHKERVFVETSSRKTAPIQPPLLTGPHQCWSMDFVSDQLFDGCRYPAKYERLWLGLDARQGGGSLFGFLAGGQIINCPKIEATLASGLFLDLTRGIISPHIGQPSQLFLDHNHRSTQFLPTAADRSLEVLRVSENSILKNIP